MSPKRRSSQPRPLAPGLEAPALYQAGLYAELQKFGKDRDSEQMLLWHEEEPDEPIKVTGLDLTVSEDKAFNAVQILLHKTGYQGNRPGKQASSSGLQWTLPVVAVTYAEYFEAYGLEKAGDGSYKGHQADEALKALRSLAETPRTIYYERKHYQGEGKARRQLTDIVKSRAPLVRLEELTAYSDLEQDEAEAVKAGQELADKIRSTGLLIEASPLLVDCISDFYILKSPALHREIQQLLGTKRVSRTVSLFIEWLLTKNTARVRISKDKLIDRLRLTKSIERRHPEEAEARLQEAFQVAKELGYLRSYQESSTGMLLFELSPERCSRISSQEPSDEAEEEV